MMAVVLQHQELQMAWQWRLRRQAVQKWRRVSKVNSAPVISDIRMPSKQDLKTQGRKIKRKHSKPEGKLALPRQGYSRWEIWMERTGLETSYMKLLWIQEEQTAGTPQPFPLEQHHTFPKVNSVILPQPKFPVITGTHSQKDTDLNLINMVIFPS